MVKTNNLLKNSLPENVFWLCNGSSLKNVRELVEALETMDEGVFRHHVNSERNDFANWIRDIFKDRELADKLQGVMVRETCVSILKERISPKKKSVTKKKKK